LILSALARPIRVASGIVRKNKRYPLTKVRQALFPRPSLSVRPGHLGAVRDEPRPILLDNRVELVVHQLQLSREGFR